MNINSKWTEPKFSRSKIIKAGKEIKKTTINKKEKKEALEVIDNWRAAHAFPMHVIYMHLRRLANNNNNNNLIVVERLKRLNSIIAKLYRQPQMNLWTMQDLGGCRFITENIDQVYFFSEKYKNSKIRHILKKEYDYIKKPKSSGYRSLHLVYQYHSDKKETYNKNMLIEIQFRTHLQHLWATAVEVMGECKNQDIKAGKGDEEIKKFFVLISALFAIKENQPLPPNIHNNKNDIIKEIKYLDEKNNFLGFLSGIKVAINQYKKNRDEKKHYYFILILNYKTRYLKIKTYFPSMVKKANADFNNYERMLSKDKDIDVVFVNAKSFKSLKSAYPNYFLDIEEFIEIINTELEKGE